VPSAEGFVDRWGRYLLIRPHEVDRAPPGSISTETRRSFFSRMIPVVRHSSVCRLVVARMNFAKFTIYTVLGCLPWTFALGWLGYILATIGRRRKTSSTIAWAALIVIIIGGAWWSRIGGDTSARSTRS